MKFFSMCFPMAEDRDVEGNSVKPVLSFFSVDIGSFSTTLFFSPGAGIGIGCWMYIVMGESVLLILSEENGNERSLWVLFGSNGAFHHSEEGCASRWIFFSSVQTSLLCTLCNALLEHLQLILPSHLVCKLYIFTLRNEAKAATHATFSGHAIKIHHCLSVQLKMMHMGWKMFLRPVSIWPLVQLYHKAILKV